MTNKKSIIGISIMFVVVAICFALMLFATSLADTQTTTESEATPPATETEKVADTPAATEDSEPASDPLPNDPFKITFEFVLTDSCPTPTYEYRKNNVVSQFDIKKDSLEFGTSAQYTCENQSGTVAINIIDTSAVATTVEHAFKFYTPLGYKSTIVTATDQSITQTTKITLEYVKYDGQYTTKITVLNQGGDQAIEGYKVVALRKDGSVAATATTDSYGQAVIILSMADATCLIVGDDTQYSDDFNVLTPESYKTEQGTGKMFVAECELNKVYPMNQVNTKVQSDSDIHKYFVYNYKQIQAGTGKVLTEYTVWKPRWNLYSPIAAGEYKVLSDGSVFHSATPSADTYEITITPVSIDGTPLHHWILSTQQSNGEQTVIYPGETFNISEGEKLVGTAVYGQADPTITAQTGDSSMPAVLALGILAASSTITLICSRKRHTLL